MFKQFATAAVVGVALLVATGTANAQHLHGHSHSGHGHGHIGHGHVHGYGRYPLGSLSFGYWPSYYSYFSPGLSYYYPNVSYGWPYTIYGWPNYGANYPNTYLGSGYFGSGVTYNAPRTTIVMLPNAAAAPNNVVPNNVAPNNVMAANTRVVNRPEEKPFGVFTQVGELAARLVRQANELCLDLHHNYQHNAGFNDTYRAAYQIFETAKFVSANQGDHAEIARRINELDALLHEVQADVRPFRRRNVQQIAGTGLPPKLTSVESTLHDLMIDVGVMGTHGAPQPAAAAVAPPAKAEVAPPPLPLQPAHAPPLPAPDPPRGTLAETRVASSMKARS